MYNMYIDYVRRSRSSSCRLLRPIIVKLTLHYITYRPLSWQHLRYDAKVEQKAGQFFYRSCDILVFDIVTFTFDL